MNLLFTTLPSRAMMKDCDSGFGSLAAGLLPVRPLLVLDKPEKYETFVNFEDGYSYYYPSDWIEFDFRGHDSAFKGRYLQLQNVRVRFIPTDKKDIHEMCPMDEGAGSVVVRAEQVAASPSHCHGRRSVLTVGAMVPCIALVNQDNISVAAETKKGFQAVLDKKDEKISKKQRDGYSFLYPFGWQEVVIEGQDKVWPEQVAETLIKKVLAPPSQKTKLIGAKEHEVDGKAYYTFGSSPKPQTMLATP